MLALSWSLINPIRLPAQSIPTPFWSGINDCCSQAFQYRDTLDVRVRQFRSEVSRLNKIIGKQDTIIIKYSRIESEQSNLLGLAQEAIESEGLRADQAVIKADSAVQITDQYRKRVEKYEGRTWVGRKLRKLDRGMSKVGYGATAVAVLTALIKFL